MFNAPMYYFTSIYERDCFTSTGHLLSLSMIFTTAVSRMNSPAPSTPGMKEELSGVNLSMTVSSYSRVMLSSVVNRRMSALVSNEIGCKFSKSVDSIGVEIM